METRTRKMSKKERKAIKEAEQIYWDYFPSIDRTVRVNRPHEDVESKILTQDWRDNL